MRILVLLTLLLDVLYGVYCLTHSGAGALAETGLHMRLVIGAWATLLMPVITLYGVLRRSEAILVVFIVYKACFALQVMAQGLWVIGTPRMLVPALLFSWDIWCFLVVLVYFRGRR